MTFELVFIKQIVGSLALEHEVSLRSVQVFFLVSEKDNLVDRLSQERLVEPTDQIVLATRVCYYFNEAILLKKLQNHSEALNIN